MSNADRTEVTVPRHSRRSCDLPAQASRIGTPAREDRRYLTVSAWVTFLEVFLPLTVWSVSL